MAPANFTLPGLQNMTLTFDLNKSNHNHTQKGKRKLVHFCPELTTLGFTNVHKSPHNRKLIKATIYSGSENLTMN